MAKTNFDELLDAGVHFGHLKRKWNPAMAPYIFMERNGIHIIDLHKTAEKLEEACNVVEQIAKSGRRILFVATKKQAKDILEEQVEPTNMPFVTERWPGGMLTNFPTIRKTIKKMTTIDKMTADGAYDNLSKRERLQIQRQRTKLEKNFGSIVDMTRLPSALFIIDINKEHIAVREAQILGIPIIALVDTNTDPTPIDFPIPANDDASKSISLILEKIIDAVKEGLSERKAEKEASDNEEKKEKKSTSSTRKRTSVKTAEKEKPEEKKSVSAEEENVEKPKVEDNKTAEKKKTETGKTKTKEETKEVKKEETKTEAEKPKTGEKEETK